MVKSLLRDLELVGQQVALFELLSGIDPVSLDGVLIAVGRRLGSLVREFASSHRSRDARDVVDHVSVDVSPVLTTEIVGGVVERSTSAKEVVRGRIVTVAPVVLLPTRLARLGPINHVRQDVRHWVSVVEFGVELIELCS